MSSSTAQTNGLTLAEYLAEEGITLKAFAERCRDQHGLDYATVHSVLHRRRWPRKASRAAIIAASGGRVTVFGPPIEATDDVAA